MGEEAGLALAAAMGMVLTIASAPFFTLGLNALLNPKKPPHPHRRLTMASAFDNLPEKLKKLDLNNNGIPDVEDGAVGNAFLRFIIRYARWYPHTRLGKLVIKALTALDDARDDVSSPPETR